MSNDNNKIIDTLTEGHTRIRSKMYLLEYPAASLEKVRDSLMAI
jgi:23S rRNA A2030 N6-methylase RlmJ